MGVFQKLFGLTCLDNFAGLKYPTVQLQVRIRVVRKVGYPQTVIKIIVDRIRPNMAFKLPPGLFL